MNELELIQNLIPMLPTNSAVVTGAGDDCAVVDVGLPDKHLLLKTDAVVEGIHFTADAVGSAVGHKALGRCLSDVAAMGGVPLCAVVTIGLPSGFEFERVRSIYEGMANLARRYDVAIVGGETTASPERVFISVAVLGTVPKSACILRSGAQPGDAIFVSGTLGGSMAGKHLEFEPRLRQGQWLAARGTVHAMIDLSDGLATDLRHLLDASHVGAELLAEAIPVSEVAKKRARQTSDTKLAPLTAALTEGEDFELLFTVLPSDAVPLLDAWKAEFPELKLSCIGKITAEHGLRIRDRRGTRPLEEHGYIHFE
ncbi:MAG: thiamine-monophosphate kinase [Verrucomicrobia bacterium]|nr:thiamine-monophosphate kinase [Verrucomicrobiota bacterium]